MSVGSYIVDDEPVKKFPVLIPGLCTFDWGPNDSLYCLNSASLTKPIEDNPGSQDGNIRKISTVDEWNSYYSSNISKQVKGDLLVVFDIEERFNYDDVLASFNEDINQYLEPDFLKFICADPSNSRKLERNLVADAVSKTNMTSSIAITMEGQTADPITKDDSPTVAKTEIKDVITNPKKLPVISFKKVSDSKKDEIKAKQQELVQQVIARRAQMQNTPFFTYRVACVDAAGLLEPAGLARGRDRAGLSVRTLEGRTARQHRRLAQQNPHHHLLRRCPRSQQADQRVSRSLTVAQRVPITEIHRCSDYDSSVPKPPRKKTS